MGETDSVAVADAVSRRGGVSDWDTDSRDDDGVAVPVDSQDNDGRRVRVRGELRHGLFGLTLMHPTLSAADAPLADALTPVYPSAAGLPQATVAHTICAPEVMEPLPAHVHDAVQRIVDELDREESEQAALGVGEAGDVAECDDEGEQARDDQAQDQAEVI